MGVSQFGHSTDWLFIDDIADAGLPVPPPGGVPVPVPQADPVPPPAPAASRLGGAALAAPGCPSWVRIKRACGHLQWVRIPCGDPMCVPCQKLWAERLRARWFPVLAQMSEPKLLTLTIKNGFDLKERLAVEAASFRRLLDTRLGPRRWPELRQAAIDFTREHLDRVLVDPWVLDERLQAWVDSLDRFGRRLKRYHTDHGEWPRVRDVLGPGFSSREITYSGSTGWHVHRHCTVDAGFLPWPLLVVLWRSATCGQGEIVDVRELGTSYQSMLEVVKYVSKSWDIPPELAGELRKALFGLKKIWPLGGAHPEDHESVCPGCGDPACRVEPGGVEFAQTLWSGKAGSSDAAVLRMAGGGVVCLVRGADGQWKESSLNLIDLVFACHSPPPRAGPDPHRVN